ncbi:MAG: hypothetical protein KF729_23630 [Sandaracinaceae bacterium]|nr:hypothetical protein [Sandaracinaceae bacterium]
MKQYHLVLLAFPSIALSACDGGGGGDPLRPDGGSTPEPTVTYHRDVAPLVARECLSCHVEGGIGPFALDTYARLVEQSEFVLPAVMAGYMPPWMPDPDCRVFEHQRQLSAAERQVFEQWVAEDMPEGDPATAPPPPPAPPAFTATHVARMTQEYLPDARVPDDYRCFLLDHTFERDSFLVGRNVVPGAGALVHHVLVYGVPPEMVATIEGADAAEDGPGYTCFGGPVPTAMETRGGALGLVGMGGWVPGALPVVEREGRGVYIPAGSRIVMQVHYNLLGNEPAADRTEYHMRITEDAPAQLATTFPTVILDLNIAAGRAENPHRAVFRNYRSDALNLTGLMPHMHLLGRQISLHRVPAAGAAEDHECLIDVPRWSFGWQESYAVRRDDAMTIAPGEGLELFCNYDNSPTNQPVINGTRVEPRDVTWGEGTLDEMCLLYVQHETPWTGTPPARGCDAAADCLAGCTSGDAECLLSCEGLAGGCRICVMESTLGCARDTCLAAYAPAAACFQTCLLSFAVVGGSFDRCMAAECPEGTWPRARDCVERVVEAGTCDARLTACGISR